MKTTINTKKTEFFKVVKFSLFSASAAIVELSVFTVLNEFTTFSYWPCYLTALILSVLWNFTLNRKFTFKSASNVPIAMLKVLAYYIVFTPVSTVCGNYLAEVLHWNEYVITILNMLLNFVTEYLYDRFVVFGGSIGSNEK